MNNEIYKFYESNKNFKDYIDKCVATYGKDVPYMLETRTAEEVYKEMQKGGCNEEKDS